MGTHSERRTKTKPFINKYNWKEITFPPEKDDWKKIEKIMQQLLLMFCMRKKKKYILLMFQNMNREEQVILLMIPNGE